MRLLDNFHDVLLVSLGSILGANIRFRIYKKLEKINLSKEYIIFVINTLSSFCLGFILSILTHINSLKYSYQLGLFFSIGLLGSLSTFSTFIFDLYDLFIKFKFCRASRLFISSIVLGILAFAVGFFLFMK